MGHPVFMPILRFDDERRTGLQSMNIATNTRRNSFDTD